MKNKGTGIQWHRIFEIAALMSVIVFAVMLYMDFGTSIKSMVGIGSDKTMILYQKNQVTIPNPVMIQVVKRQIYQIKQSYV